MSPHKAKIEFDKSMAHIIAAYRFFRQTVPDSALFAAGRPVRVGTFEFERPSQAKSMIVELGWAFFTRCEGCLEALWTRLGMKDHTRVSKVIEESGEFTAEELSGWRQARELRNMFHHGDGDATLLRKSPTSVDIPEGREPHLFPEHVEQFHSLFCKIAKCIARPKQQVV